MAWARTVAAEREVLAGVNLNAFRLACFCLMCNLYLVYVSVQYSYSLLVDSFMIVQG